jgi:hypothetical protein
MVKTFAISQLTWPILKGLSLIAQINFQRATGVQNTKKNHTKTRPVSIPIQGTKNLRAESFLSTRHLSSSIEGANYIKTAPHVNRLFSQSLPPLRGRLLKDYQSPSRVQEIF